MEDIQEEEEEEAAKEYKFASIIAPQVCFAGSEWTLI